MSRALSTDLRIRVLAAVSDGSSHREAAARFGVSAASVSRWRALQREQGCVTPGPLGGDRRSGAVEAQADLIHRIIQARPDITLVELRLELQEHGHCFGHGTLHRFMVRHGLTRKKRQATLQSKTAPTS